MKQSYLCPKALLLIVFLLFCSTSIQSIALPGRSFVRGPGSEAAPVVQFDDPYSDFRNAHYSNAGLLNERDEIKLGTQLNREVTKKFNLTDSGLERVERIGQRCAKPASGQACFTSSTSSRAVRLTASRF